MPRPYLTGLLGLILALVLMFSAGCHPFRADRQAMRLDSISKDVDRSIDDIDWALGLDEPSMLYEKTFPPYRREAPGW
jgi:hypothetical protein